MTVRLAALLPLFWTSSTLSVRRNVPVTLMRVCEKSLAKFFRNCHRIDISIFVTKTR